MTVLLVSIKWMEIYDAKMNKYLNMFANISNLCKKNLSWFLNCCSFPTHYLPPESTILINCSVPWHCRLVCVSHALLTWAGGARRSGGGPSASARQQRLLILSQGLFGQVALPLDLQLQGLGDIRDDPVDGSQHKEDHMLQEEMMMNLLIRLHRTTSAV